jgi:hypothetical protein
MQDQLARISGRPAAGHHTITAASRARVASASIAGDPSAPSAGVRTRWVAILRYFDVVLVVLAAVPALALGVPVLGYVIGAGAWILQRIVAKLDRRWVSRATEPRTQLGFNLFEAFGRIWLLAGAIVIAGIAGGRADGLTAALVIFCAYSVAFVIRVFSGPPTAPAPRSPAGGSR